ncbi:MAG: electron transfer flavoprotein subunit alpha/FixB family protein [Bdellovibrio sp.]
MCQTCDAKFSNHFRAASDFQRRPHYSQARFLGDSIHFEFFNEPRNFLEIRFSTESQGSELKRSSLELLSWAQKNSTAWAAVGIFTEASEAAILAYGPEKIFVFPQENLHKAQNEHLTEGLKQAVEAFQCQIVLGSVSSRVKDLFPRCAAKLKASCLGDLVELDHHQMRATKPLFSGKVLGRFQLKPHRIHFLSFRPNQLPVETGSKASKGERIALHIQRQSPRAELVETKISDQKKIELTEASRIVSGGRGLKEASNFHWVEKLAEALSAATGASRAIVDAGWVGHSLQVGQTGKTVAPNLYIAAGISGAIQHLAGMSGSRVIVAINTDPNAPIFQKATYGIVGDALSVLPELIGEFKKSLN